MRDDIEKRYHDILFHSETDADFIAHYGVKGQKHGIRRWQNEDGSLTPEGYRHYGIDPNRMTAKSPEPDKNAKFDNAKWEKNESGEWIVDDKYEFNVYNGVPKDKARKVYASMDDNCLNKEAVLNELTNFDYAKEYGPDYKKDLSNLLGKKVQIDLIKDADSDDGCFVTLGFESDKMVDDFVDKYGVYPIVDFIRDKNGRRTLKNMALLYGD